MRKQDVRPKRWLECMYTMYSVRSAVQVACIGALLGTTGHDANIHSGM